MRKIFIYGYSTFSSLSVFVTVSHIILFKFLFNALFLLLYVWNGTPEATKFLILSKAFQNYAPLVPFQNKWPKYELNI